MQMLICIVIKPLKIYVNLKNERLYDRIAGFEGSGISILFLYMN